MGEPCRDQHSPLETPRQFRSSSPVRANAPVGNALDKVRAELERAGRCLRNVIGDGEAGLVDDGLRLLSDQVCRIAVIGQIKAGKSSFINALVEKHDLLPTDVNPWTTAVTRLNFNQGGEGPAATFQFFTADEWQRLAQPNGRVADLTERFVPGFERQLLTQHIAALRARAERRLGPTFTALLGQNHDYDAVTGDVLRRYVCAGDPLGLGTATSPVGQFADITRSAELTIEGGPFALPTTVIDTPGTNDPFLVRDEITRSCLDSADIYLVVLSARQPLGPSDLALLRILRGLHKEQIVIFINRIDELSDIRAERDTVVEFVRRRLERELPGSSIPVIAGSAWWAHIALASQADGIERAIDGRSLSYFADAGHIRRDDLVKPASQGAERARLLRRALIAASGLPQVHATLDSMLKDCRLTHVMAQLIASFGEMASAVGNRASLDLNALSQDFELSLLTAERSGEELQRLDAEMARLEEVAATIEKAANAFRSQLNETVNRETMTMRSRMIAAVDAFSSEQAHALYETLAHGSEIRRWSCDTDQLRRALADDFIRGYRAAEQRINALRDSVVPQLKLLLTLLAGKQARDDGLAPARAATSTPPRMAALSTELVLDLHLPWWRAWWSGRPTPEQRSRELSDLVRDDLFPLVDDLMNSCSADLEARVDQAAKWSFGVSSAIVMSLRAQHERLLVHYRALSENIGSAASPDAIAAKRAYMAELQQRAATGEEVTRSIAALAATMQSTLESLPEAP